MILTQIAYCVLINNMSDQKETIRHLLLYYLFLHKDILLKIFTFWNKLERQESEQIVQLKRRVK